MKKKQFVIVFYDNKKHLCNQFIYQASNIQECTDYISKSILTHKMYDEERNFPASIFINELKEKQTPMGIEEIDVVFITYCKKKGYTDLEIKVMEVMEDGKTVQEGADALCISKKALEKLITRVNSITGKKSLMGSIYILHHPARQN